jgi:hypothetical protein
MAGWDWLWELWDELGFPNITIPGIGFFDKFLVKFYIPETTPEGEPMAVYIGLPISPLPGFRVKLHVVHKLTNKKKEINLEPVANYLGISVWKGEVPGDYLFAGTIFSYFTLNYTALALVIPSEGDTYPFITAVKAQPFPWVGEYFGGAIGRFVLKMRLTRRKKDGSVWVTAKGPSSQNLFHVPAYVTPLNLDSCAVIADHRDGGAWVTQVDELTSVSKKVRLIKVMPDGSIAKEVSWGYFTNSTVFDPVRDRLWLGASTIEIPRLKVIAVNGYSLKSKNVLPGKSMGKIFGGDYVSGDIFMLASATPSTKYLHRVSPQFKLTLTKLREISVLKALPDGEVVDFRALGVPGIDWRDKKLKDKYSPVHFNEVVDLTIDKDGQRICALAVPNSHVTVFQAINNKLTEEFTIADNAITPGSKIRYLWSVATDYFNQEFWLSYSTVYNRYYLAKINPQTQKIEAKRLMKERAIISNFRPDGEMPKKLKINLEPTYPLKIKLGSELKVAIKVPEHTPVPIWVRMKVSRQGGLKSAWFLAERTGDYKWQGRVPKDFFDVCTYKIEVWAEGYGCECRHNFSISVISGSGGGTPPSGIKLVNPQYPDKIGICQSPYVNVQVKPGSPMPSSVEAIFWNDYEKKISAPCEKYEDGRWFVGLPFVLCRKPEVKFYFYAKGTKKLEGKLPDGAPNKCYRINIISQEKAKFDQIILPDYAPAYKPLSIGARIKSAPTKAIVVYFAGWSSKDNTLFNYRLRRYANDWWRTKLPEYNFIPGTSLYGFFYIQTLTPQLENIGFYPGPRADQVKKIAVV